jgi:hypothetical protein
MVICGTSELVRFSTQIQYTLHNKQEEKTQKITLLQVC